MRALIGCEKSGVIRRAMRARGIDTWSCDVAFAEDGDAHHYTGDIFEVLDFCMEHGMWPDLFIVHPECTYLASSGLHWNRRIPGREALTTEALDFALRLWGLPIKKLCMENPIGRLTKVCRELGAHIQIVQPHQFGHDASKATALITRGLPPLVPTEHVAPRMVNGKPRWGNQTDSGQNRLGPSPTRSAQRAETYPGIADAMAEQWGQLWS